jgi:hypothetical protein
MFAVLKRKPTARFWVISTLVVVGALGWLLPASDMTSKAMFAVGILGAYLAVDSAKTNNQQKS